MKKIIGILLLASLAQAADLTAPLSTTNNQLYNQAYRDVKDGTNATTVDTVVGNLFSNVSTTTTVKSGGGYLGNLIVNATCSGQSVVLADATALPQTAAATISTFTATQGSYPINARFTTGLTVGIAPAATCPQGVTVTYR